LQIILIFEPDNTRLADKSRFDVDDDMSMVLGGYGDLPSVNDLDIAAAAAEAALELLASNVNEEEEDIEGSSGSDDGSTDDSDDDEEDSSSEEGSEDENEEEIMVGRIAYAIAPQAVIVPLAFTRDCLLPG
jgi:hypothetical protein